MRLYNQQRFTALASIRLADSCRMIAAPALVVVVRPRASNIFHISQFDEICPLFIECLRILGEIYKKNTLVEYILKFSKVFRSIPAIPLW